MQGELIPKANPFVEVDDTRMRNRDLSQYFTPGWAAEMIVERHLAHLSPGDLVIEPAVGDGTFLAAIPSPLAAVGVEIDPAMAALARANSGREVIVGDFRAAALPDGARAIIGNPPFDAQLVSQFLDRSWHLLGEGGSAGFILPAYMLQTSTSVNRMHQRWSIEQNLLPRNLFPRLRLPIVWTVFTKERTRRLVGFFLYGEAAEIAKLQKDCRKLAECSGQGQTWRTVTRFVLQMLGGEADLDEIYSAIEPRRPSKVNRSWQARVRNVLQTSGEYTPVRRGRWRIAGDNASQAA